MIRMYNLLAWFASYLTGAMRADWSDAW